MKIKLSYLTINLLFINDLDYYGLWIPPDARDLDAYDLEWGEKPLLNQNEGYILIRDSLTGHNMVDSLQHELNHAGYWLYAPSDEESQVRVTSSVWNEALSRNPKLKQLVLEAYDE